MIQRLSHVGLYVVDQDAARDFYVNKLGFEVRTDATMDNGYRWLTVGPKSQPDLEIILQKVGHPMMKPEAAVAIRKLLDDGSLSGGAFDTADCRKTYEELTAKGVEFLQPPTERFYGIEALMKDNSGNWFSLTQHKGPTQKGM
jgi:catechol 2,3-dioxygenase-like lactoylglutathione lyase family enzyme